MENQQPLPPMTDFVKTINVILLVQFAVVMLLAGGSDHALAAAHRTVSAAMLVASWLMLGGFVLSNLLTLSNSATIGRIPGYEPYAKTSKNYVTVATALLLTGFFFADGSLQLFAGLVAAGGAVGTLFFGKGKFLLP